MVCLLKFDAFFLIGFSIQFLILVTGTPTAELGEFPSDLLLVLVPQEFDVAFYP